MLAFNIRSLHLEKEQDMATKVWSGEEYAKLDAGIANLVRSLHILGISTVESCEGHVVRRGNGMVVLPWPWVIIATSDEEAERLAGKIIQWNGLAPAERWMISGDRIFHGTFSRTYVESVVGAMFPTKQVNMLCPEETNPMSELAILTAFQMEAEHLAIFFEHGRARRKSPAAA